MMKSHFTLLLLLSTLWANSQNVNLDLIKDNLKQIRTVDYTIDQSLYPRSGNIVDFEMKSTDKKGRTSIVIYRVNLDDIDPYGFKSGLERDLLKLEVHAVGKQARFAEVKDGKISRYLKRFKIDAEDGDNVEVLTNAIESAALSAAAITDRKYDYGDIGSVMKDLMEAVNLGGGDQGQSIVEKADKPGKLSVKMKRGKYDMRYDFNLSDLNATELKLNARGTSISVTPVTNARQKVIKVYENEVSKTFVDRFNIHASDLENGKRILRLLELAVRVSNGYVLSGGGPAVAGNSAGAIGGSLFNFQLKVDGKVPKPDFSNQPFWAPPSSSAVEKFEKSSFQTEARGKFASTEGLYFLNGKRSSVRFKGDDKIIAVIWLSEAGQDPSNILSLYKFQVNSRTGRREYVSSTSNFMRTKIQNTDVTVPVSYKPIGDNLFVIVADEPLKRGEYFFATEKYMFAFGVD